MNFRQFETLYWIAHLGSFRAASRHLKMTQPTVSARVRELERELGVELFDRSAHSARLTAKGRELLPYAEQIVAMALQIQQHVSQRDAIAGKVRLGVTSIPARTWLPRLSRDLKETYPGVELEIVVESSEHLRDELLSGGMDVAFLAGPFHTAHMRTVAIGDVRMTLLACPSLDLPAEPVEAKQLEPFHIISGPRGSHLHQLASEWFRQGGAQLRHNHACSSLTTRISMAVEGMGLAIATPAAATREIAEGRLRVVETVLPFPSLEYVVAFPQVTISPAVQLVADMAKQLIIETPDIHYYYSHRDAREPRRHRTDPPAAPSEVFSSASQATASSLSDELPIDLDKINLSR